MINFEQTSIFCKWRDNLKDAHLRALIATRLDRLSYGHFGDVKPVGDGISELRIHYGAGYRIYFQKRGKEIILLLCGGDKSTQSKDIKDAKHLAKLWSEKNE